MVLFKAIQSTNLDLLQTRGMYAVSVMGKLPSYIQRELERQGIKYKSRDLGI